MSKAKEAVLLAPNTLGSYKFSGKNRENLALGVLGAYLTKNGVHTELIDARLDHLSHDETIAEIVRLQPLLLGVTLMGREAAVWTGPLIKALREELPDTHIVAGSYFPTLNTERAFNMLPELDAIALGEGEDTLLELVYAAKEEKDFTGTTGIAHKQNGQIVYNPWRNSIRDLNQLPTPLRYADPNLISKVSLEGSRGCMARCTFCSIGPHTHPKKSSWRGKTPQRIIEELVHIRNQYPNIDQYRFVDSDFVGLNTPEHVERLRSLAQGMLRAGFNQGNANFYVETQSIHALAVPADVWEAFRRAGLYQIFVGVENSSEKVKRAINKPSDFETDLRAIEYLRGFGFNVTYGFIMINPWSNMEDVLQNVDALGRLGNAGLDKYFSELIVNPGTRAYEQVSDEHGLLVQRVEGIDRYSFPLPNGLETIRRVGRYMLENAPYRPFLEHIASLYTKIDNIQLKGEKDRAVAARRALDRINQSFFLSVTDWAQASEEPLEEDQIKLSLDYLVPQTLEQIQVVIGQYSLT